MNIIVCLKQILDPEIPARDFRVDGGRKEAARGSANLVTNIFCENALDQVNDANLADPVTLTFGGRSRITARANMVLGHALDLADHYSQLANYMRLNNILPPSALPRPGRGGN